MSKSVGVEKSPTLEAHRGTNHQGNRERKAPTQKVQDADGGGLRLLVAPSGSKLWVWRYRFNGAEKNMHFGEYPRVTLKDACELRFAARKLLGTGINPVADRKAEVESKQMAVKAEQRQADNSFEKIACGWWSWWSFDKSPRHAETILRRLETDVFPAYGHKPNDVVTVTDIRKLMLAVQAEVQET
jgi:hypothetical protein